MKIILSLAMLVALGVMEQSTTCRAAEEDGVALAIIYDTSGSMHENVRNLAGKSSPKYVIANRALVAVAKQLQAFATSTAGGAPRKINTGLFVFSGDNAREAVRFGPFDAAALENFARNFSSPSGNTPLGNALSTATLTVLNSPLSRKHVLIITDGVNTEGPTPAEVMPRLKQEAEGKHTTLSIHFVAFDVDAKVFDPVKKLGATVLGAGDEKQLNTQLEFILQRKILLEEEEPPKQK
ncbi:MAG: VWA domain-containing protein [Verrucomicrobia bacterium]|nr:VWA domain-containing protein [Verrucomicrobiota bacterium]